MKSQRLLIVLLLAIGIACLGLGVYSVTRKSEQGNAQQAPTPQIIERVVYVTPHPTQQAPPELPSAPAEASSHVALSKQAEVTADQMWVDTGIDVTGKTVRIRYLSGAWKNHPNSRACDGEGLAPYADQALLIVPEGNLSALVGKAGKHKFVVNNFIESKLGTGRLYLSINDKAGYYDDNSGALLVEITLLK